MKTLKGILSFLGWLITLALQIGVGMLAGFFAAGVRNLPSFGIPLMLWLANVIGVVLVGSLALLLRRSIQPKKYLSRMLFSALGAAFPAAGLIVALNAYGMDSPMISDRYGPILSILTLILAILGFYIPGWMRARKSG